MKKCQEKIMYQLFCDSNCELWYTTVKELGLNVIRMPYTLEDQQELFYDLGETHDFKSFFDKMRAGVVPKTQALNEFDYIEYFEPVLAAGEDIIYVHFSRNMSGTFAQMDQAIAELKEKYPNRKISVVDTKSISIGEALIVYEAALLWKRGATDEEVVKFVEDNRQNYTVYFTVKDLTQLKRGGRISSISYVAGTILNIKPVLCVEENGTLMKYGTAKGAKAALKTLVSRVKEIGSQIFDHPIIIAYADAEESADELKQMLISEFGDKLTIWTQQVGPTVGSHCGAGTVGIAFHSTKR